MAFAKTLNEKKRWIWLGIGILVVLLIWWALQPNPVPVDVATVETGTFRQIVTEDGITRARNRHVIAAIDSGLLRRVEFNPGDRVQRGQLIAVINVGVLRLHRSPIDGLVSRVERESEGPIERGRPILELIESQSLEIVADVLTTEAVSIRSGMPVQIDHWGGEKLLDGRVRLVEPTAFTKVSALGVEEQRVRVIIDIISPKDEWLQLGDNYRIVCRILTYIQEDVTLVPIGALFREGEGWATFIVEGDRARKRFVRIERRNPSVAVVADGLRPGDQVILFPGEGIADGTLIAP